MKSVSSGPVRPDDSVLYVADRVRTLSAEQPIADALLVRWGKVAAVGSREKLQAANPGARGVELRGATIVPGLVDAHGHMVSLGRSLSILSFVGTSSVEEILQMARNASPASYEGDWLVGRGWDQTAWGKGGGFPTRQQLDAVVPSTPVYFTRVDGHAVWVNSEGLRRAGVGRATPDPPGGRIIRDRGGEPTGVLVDNAMQLVGSKIPLPTDEQRQHWLRAAVEKCVSVGLTSVHDAGTDVPTSVLLRQWDATGTLPLRIYAMALGKLVGAMSSSRWGAAGAAVPETGIIEGKLFTLRAVKFWLDGALGSRGAALHAPYSDEPTQNGLLLIEPAELQRRATALMERGYQIAVHAIGDRGNTLALDILSKAAADAKVKDPRNRIEHAQILRREDIPRFAQLGIIASMQPTHATSDMRWAEQRVGRERIAGAYAWKSLLDARAHLAFGSDFPVEDANPLLGLYAARTRQDVRGYPAGGWLPEQRLDGEQALIAFTAGAAYAAFAEEERGRLRPGMDADFTALSVDPVGDPPEKLLSGKALLTVVAGRVAYRDESVLRSAAYPPTR